MLAKREEIGVERRELDVMNARKRLACQCVQVPLRGIP
jgi:hypothetical protein